MTKKTRERRRRRQQAKTQQDAHMYKRALNRACPDCGTRPGVWCGGSDIWWSSIDLWMHDSRYHP